MSRRSFPIDGGGLIDFKMNEEDKMKIFVPGGNGFVGKRVVKKLEGKGLNFTSLSLRDGIDFRSFDQVKALFEKENFDAVINCAAFVGSILFAHTRPATP